MENSLENMGQQDSVQAPTYNTQQLSQGQQDSVQAPTYTIQQTNTQNTQQVNIQNPQQAGTTQARPQAAPGFVPTYRQGVSPEQYNQMREAKRIHSIESIRKYGLLAFLFALIHTVCLYRNTSGITYPFYMIGAFIIMHFIRRADGLSIMRNRHGKMGLSLFYMISLFALSISKCTTANEFLLGVDGLAITLLLFSFVIYLYIDTTGWDISSWFLGIISTMVIPFETVGDPISDLSAWSNARGDRVNVKRRNTILGVLIGIAISIPLLYVVLSLLSEADIVFKKILDVIFDVLILPDNIWDLVGILLFFIATFWVVYTVPKRLMLKGLPVKAYRHGKFNPVIAITFTSITAFFYLIFSVVQIVYLFAGKMTLPESYTYAEYAHEGFYQLLVVSVINLCLVVICQKCFKESIVLKIVLTVIALCTYIMMISSASRMFMYIAVYHLTFLRVLVLWFLAVIFLWLTYLVVGMYVDAFPVYTACVITATIMYVVFAFAHPDYFIAKYDMATMTTTSIGGKMDREGGSVKGYLTREISMDAVPALAQDKELLQEYSTHMDSEAGEYEKYYKEARRFNFSRYIAKKYISALDN